MKINNRYICRSKISEAKFREIVRCFSADLDATQITSLTGLNRNTVNRYLKAIRERIAEQCEAEAPLTCNFDGDESFFGIHRVKIIPAIGENGKTSVFGLIKQYSKVYTRIVTDYENTPPKKSIIAGMLSRDGVIYPNGVPNSERITNEGFNNFATSLSRVNGIEGFWNLAKSRLAKFRGLNKDTFYLHLKECEFRYNYRNQNLYLKILKLVREKPLFI